MSLPIRAMNPAERHFWIECERASEAHRAASEAYNKAVARRDWLLAQFDDVATSHRFEALGIDGEVGLSPRDRSRRS